MRQLNYQSKLRHMKLLRRSSHQPQFAYWQIFTSCLCSFIGIAVLAYLTVYPGYR